MFAFIIMKSNTKGQNQNQNHYTYLFKNSTIIDAKIQDIFDDPNNSKIKIVAYHITKNNKYPFIQILLQNHSSLLHLPEIDVGEHVTDDEKTLEDIILNHMNSLLLFNYYDRYQPTQLSYNGIFTDYTEQIYALVDVSCIDITNLFFSEQDNIILGLPTEIINHKNILNIPIHSNVVDLFVSMPELFVLHQTNNLKIPFLLPDVAYGHPDLIKRVSTNSIIGMRPAQYYNSCGAYYFFYKTLQGALKHMPIQNKQDKQQDKKDNTNKNENQMGINRYAIFPENYSIYIETKDALSLTDNDIYGKYDYSKCIYIEFIVDNLEYINEDSLKPNILIKDFDNYFPLSYHL